jgi:hypothetical protein
MEAHASSRQAEKDWFAWHDGYDRLSTQRQRLEVVRDRTKAVLDTQPPGPIRVISLCAGQGRDLLPVVAHHPRRDDIQARLVELDPRNAQVATIVADGVGLSNCEVIEGDAALTATFNGAVPADLVLLCGVLGNISYDDVIYTIEQLPSLCAPHATIIWTRGGKPPDLRQAIRRLFAHNGYQEKWWEGPPKPYGVGVHQLAVNPPPYDPSQRLFHFIR